MGYHCSFHICNSVYIQYPRMTLPYQRALSDDSLRIVRTKTSKTTASCVAFFMSTLLKTWRSGQKLTGVRSPALPTLGSHDLTLTSFVARTTPRCATDACPGDRSRRQVEEEEGSGGWGSKPCPSVLRESIGFPPAAIPLFLLLLFFLLFGFFGRSSF